MHIPLAGLWQLSPLTDLSIPQDDITFPGPLSAVLPSNLSEDDILKQEWHLMHDIDVDEEMLANSAVDLVISGIGYHAEIRINGEAIFDCDDFQEHYRKDVLPYLQLGRNRFEILFLEPDDDWLLDEEHDDIGNLTPIVSNDIEARMGIWHTPYLEVLPTVRLERVETEQVCHLVGGCEFLVHLHYAVFKPGLLSAEIKFNGMTYRLPIDVRASKATAIFQLDAPKYIQPGGRLLEGDCYQLDVQLEQAQQIHQIGLVNGSDEGTTLHYQREIPPVF
ncbi:hypothetical protein QF117_07660 [Vibrio sp. YMD68]|uniref:glycosyl hydrolase 2 galactose-binding domain-containing protein n=1 Tax=Vibrio sp. YMD68 TaxID=3042300 RepID=UPI002499E985|nr:hypothetical protein [Vibrio sp. YMD68]WGW00703.1 hypothetical protein QF117_07660 [Vibrio sp. YMD68]